MCLRSEFFITLFLKFLSVDDCTFSCHPHEIYQFTMALKRTLGNYMMFNRFPEELLVDYIKFVAHWACQLVGPAIAQVTLSHHIRLFKHGKV